MVVLLLLLLFVPPPLVPGSFFLLHEAAKSMAATATMPVNFILLFTNERRNLPLIRLILHLIMVDIEIILFCCTASFRRGMACMCTEKQLVFRTEIDD